MRLGKMNGVTMWIKGLLAIAFSAVLSGTAQAGSTITDKSYWLNEARRSVQAGAPFRQRDLYSAFAHSHGAPKGQVAPDATGGGFIWRYQGGPKSR
ncbi:MULTISPECIES: hypothetical protein [Bradyrhizobium]|uniref:hypothetical protein n=1 Tax=Bradyrhizobium TaxID=374 RepID=UPI001FED3ED9|nr:MULTISPECIES: hypothetical protein [Bradyrhizobium]